MSNKVYEIITEQILAELEKGQIPWNKPWKGGLAGTPISLSTGKPYRGVNVFLLKLRGYNSPYWLTFKQARKLGGSVLKDEKATIVCYWKRIKVKDKADPDKDKIIPMLRYFRVFNLEQCENVTSPHVVKEDKDEKAPEFKPIERCEKVVVDMPKRPNVSHGGDTACYSPSSDSINMPHKENFDSPEFYYTVLFHELAHSTGHETRLDRKNYANSGFGSENYGKEELVAEMTAAFVSGHCHIDNTRENSAAYVQGWLKSLKNDVKMVVMAAAQAQKAADYILNVTWDTE